MLLTNPAVINNRIIKKGLKETSIFSAEVYAIDLALNLISENKSKNFVIFSISQSIKIDNPLNQ